MKRLCAIALTLFLAAACFAQSAPLNNQAVLTMLKSGIADSVIITAIHAQAAQFSISANDLIALKAAGASDNLLTAMIEKNSSNATARISPTAPDVNIPASVSEVHTVFIAGNNEAAADMRRDLLKDSTKFQQSACFTVLGSKQHADAILDLAQAETAGGSGGFLGGSSLESTVASATLTNQHGDLLWNDSKQGLQGVIHTGAGNAETNLLRSLFKAAGCRFNGQRASLDSKNKRR